MKYGMVAVVALACLVAGPRQGAAEMACEEFSSGEAICDDGARMYYRADTTAQFVLLDNATRQLVINYLISQAAGGGQGALAEDDDAGGSTTHYGSGGSVTSYGDCVSLSAPGMTFMGSGC